ncbi:MAG: tetratricopeptide repeat protein [Candidatus Thorarchaeota archaeon]
MVNVKENSSSAIQNAVKLIERGLFKEAIDELRLFLQANPESIEGWYNLGYALTEHEDYDDAIKAYDEALAIDNGIFDVWFNKGTVLYEQRDFEHAKECYEKALEINPEDAEAWNNLGNCFSRLADGRSAIEAYTRAVALKPDYAEAFYNKANAHFIEEEDEKAIAYAEVALELNPALMDRISQWINVSRNRLVSKRDQEEHDRRISERLKNKD